MQFEHGGANKQVPNCVNCISFKLHALKIA